MLRKEKDISWIPPCILVVAVDGSQPVLRCSGSAKYSLPPYLHSLPDRCLAFEDWLLLLDAPSDGLQRNLQNLNLC